MGYTFDKFKSVTEFTNPDPNGENHVINVPSNTKWVRVISGSYIPYDTGVVPAICWVLVDGLIYPCPAGVHIIPCQREFECIPNPFSGAIGGEQIGYGNEGVGYTFHSEYPAPLPHIKKI